MGYMVLTALGAGVVGLTAARVIQNEKSGMALAAGAGLWLGLSAVIALFFGSYYTLRISKYVTNKIGAAHAFVIASVFFILLGMGATSSVGAISSGLSQIAQNLSANDVSISNGVAASRAVADAGWSLFATFLVGIVAAVLGGRLGAQANASRPLAAEDTEPFLARAVGQ